MERIPILCACVQRLHPRLDHAVKSKWQPVIPSRLEWTHSKGIVVYTVTNPAMPPIPNVIVLGRVWPGRAVPCTNCLSVAYVVNRTAEFAPWRIICWRYISSGNKQGKRTRRRQRRHTTGNSPRYIPERPSWRTMDTVPWMRPRYCGSGLLASWISLVLWLRVI